MKKVEENRKPREFEQFKRLARKLVAVPKREAEKQMEKHERGKEKRTAIK